MHTKNSNAYNLACIIYKALKLLSLVSQGLPTYSLPQSNNPEDDTYFTAIQLLDDF